MTWMRGARPAIPRTKTLASYGEVWPKPLRGGGGREARCIFS